MHCRGINRRNCSSALRPDRRFGNREMKVGLPLADGMLAGFPFFFLFIFPPPPPDPTPPPQFFRDPLPIAFVSQRFDSHAHAFLFSLYFFPPIFLLSFCFLPLPAPFPRHTPPFFFLSFFVFCFHFAFLLFCFLPSPSRPFFFGSLGKTVLLMTDYEFCLFFYASLAFCFVTLLPWRACRALHFFFASLSLSLSLSRSFLYQKCNDQTKPIAFIFSNGNANAARSRQLDKCAF
jgi:hypothetical protein